jgi:CRP-like cAMP-binding protein
LSERVTHSLVKALRAVPDFASLDDRTLLKILGASANLFWPKGKPIFEKGSPAEALYVILSGQVRIFDSSGGREEEISRVGPGDSFGELSLLLRTMHTKNAVALEDCELMVVPRDEFEPVLKSNPEVASQFRRKLEERIPIQGEEPA